jgi:hypothetical protein
MRIYKRFAAERKAMVLHLDTDAESSDLNVMA